MPYYDPTRLAQAKNDLAALSADSRMVTSYADTHLESLGRRDGGVLYSHFLSGHDDCQVKFDGLITGTTKLLGNAGDHLGATMVEYAKGEQANLDTVSQLWAALEMSEGLQPVGPPPTSGLTPGPLPSTVLQEPTTQVGHWVFDVLSWPDLLSAGSWVRKIISAVWEFCTGVEPWTWLWEWLGGDFEQIGVVADAWKNLSEYFSALPEELGVRMQIMFEGWYDSDAATAAGGYFAEAIKALGECQDPLGSLAQLYGNVAWSSFGFFQMIYSLVDAAIDTVITFLLSGATVLEAIAAFFSGGAAAVPATVTAVLAAVQAVSAAWGWMMTAVYGVLGFAALLGAAVTDVTWVTLPEG